MRSHGGKLGHWISDSSDGFVLQGKEREARVASASVPGKRESGEIGGAHGEEQLA